MRYGSVNLTGFDYPERLRLGLVSADFFQVLGVTPVAGRAFVRGEDEPGSDRHLAVLSHGFWTARFGRDHATVGRSITLNGEGYLVIGVLPPGEPWLNEADVFIPLIRRPDADRGSFELAVIGRLKPGVSGDAAQADLNSVAEQLARVYQADQGMGVRMRPASSWVASDSLRRALWILLGAVGFLLLIACVNLANLFLARGSGRARERALRAALGASRGRIMRQVLTESLLVSVSGAALGLALAFAILQLLRGLAPEGIPRLGQAGINLWVLGFTALITVITALLAGTLPAVQAGHTDLLTALREGERNQGGGRRLGRLRGLLVALEVAASLALLVGAGLLLRSFGAVLNVDRGFETEHRMLAEVALPGSYDGERATQFLAQVRERLMAVPGVKSVAAVSLRPLQGVGPGMGFAAADKPSPSGDRVPWASWRIITGGYLSTLGIPLIRGRDFNEQDVISKPWRVIVSRRLADLVWPGEDAVGRTLILWKGQSNDPAEVIGVAGDTREWGLADEQALVVYLPFYGAAISPVYFVVNGDISTAAMGPLLRTTLLQLDPNVPLSRVESMEQLVGESVASRRFIMLLLLAFATVAVLLALAGVYGVLSYAVSRRTGEIGVRLALGASHQRVLGMIIRQGMAPVVMGLGVGLAAALALTKLMTSLLFGIGATDVLTYVAVAALLGVAALVSCYLPARQALRVDAVAALKQE
jgi:putative ABC transport system permease protein